MTFDEWWKANALTPEMMGSLEAWARLVWETGHANGYTAALERAPNGGSADRSGSGDGNYGMHDYYDRAGK